MRWGKLAMRNSKSAITRKQKEFARAGIVDPGLFARRFLGVELWDKQVEILRSIRKHRKTVIKSSHGVGKTFVLALAVLWWLARYKDGIVLTTSSTLRQVKTQLWSEIRRLVAGAKVPYPEINTTDFKFRGDNNFALGFSTDRAENFQGYHGKHVLIIADEAPSIDATIWEAIAGIMVTRRVRSTSPWPGTPQYPVESSMMPPFTAPDLRGDLRQPSMFLIRRI